jgi:N utilization substance protein B
MSTRHLARERAVQFMFQLDFNTSEDIGVSLEDFWHASEEKNNDNLKKFAEVLIRGVIEHRDELDRKIQAYARNWDVQRMGAVDRNVLRLALYEIFYRSDIPPVVSVNEALDLARELSSDESAKFVNGIVDRALKDIDRPLRTSSEDKV